MIKAIYILIFFFALIGCEKNVTIQLNNPGEQLVVDGSIENGKAPQIILTHSLNYFSQISADILANSFVHNAVITLTDGNKTALLKEYNYAVGPYTFYFYSNDSSASAQKIIGKLNTNYSLNILSNGKTYTNTTTIPNNAKTLDSIWWQPANNQPDTTIRNMFAKVTDPPGLGNYIRFFTQVNNKGYFPLRNSAFNDDVVDGTTYVIQFGKGKDRNIPDSINNVDQNNFHRGDTVGVKFCNIDKVTYDFWRTMEYNYASIGNPFSTPVKVLGNISGGALGYFGGYSVQYKTIVIPK